MGCVQVTPLHTSQSKREDSSSNSQSPTSAHSGDSIEDICESHDISPSDFVLSQYSIFSPTSRRNMNELERKFREDRRDKIEKLQKKKSPVLQGLHRLKPLKFKNRVMSHSIDDEQDIISIKPSTINIKHKTISFTDDQDGKGLFLNLPSSMIDDEDDEDLGIDGNGNCGSYKSYKHRISRTLDCDLEQAIKEQNLLIKQISVQYENGSFDKKVNDSFINKNYYYEDYHESDHEFEQYVD